LNRLLYKASIAKAAVEDFKRNEGLMNEASKKELAALEKAAAAATRDTNNARQALDAL
jgi:hypothetical protein